MAAVTATRKKLHTYASVGTAVLHFADNIKLRSFQIHGTNFQYNSSVTASLHTTLYMNRTNEGLYVELMARDAISTNADYINRLKPNDPYMGRTAPLTSKRCILYIYSTNIGTEYFKHALYFPFSFSSKCSLFHNANLFGSCIIHILHIGCAKI